MRVLTFLAMELAILLGLFGFQPQAIPWMVAAWALTLYGSELLRRFHNRYFLATLHRAGEGLLALDKELATERARRQEALAHLETLREQALQCQAAGFRQIVEKMDLSGQFLILAWMWKRAIQRTRRNGKANHAAVNGQGHTNADNVRLLWQQLGNIATKRWPGAGFTDLELEEVATQAFKNLGIEPWKKLCCSPFGFRDPDPVLLLSKDPSQVASNPMAAL